MKLCYKSDLYPHASPFPLSSVPLFFCSSILLFLYFFVPLFFIFSFFSLFPLFFCSFVAMFLFFSAPVFICFSVLLFFASCVPVFLDNAILLFVSSSVFPLSPFPCVPSSHLPRAFYSTTARVSRFLHSVVSFHSYFFPLFPYFSRHYSFFRPFSRFSLSSALLTSNSLIWFDWKQLHTSQSNKVITHLKELFYFLWLGEELVAAFTHGSLRSKLLLPSFTCARQIWLFVYLHFQQFLTSIRGKHRLSCFAHSHVPRMAHILVTYGMWISIVGLQVNYSLKSLLQRDSNLTSHA